MGCDKIRCLAKFLSRLKLAFGCHNLGTALALGLSLLGHGALHIIRKDNIFDFNRSDLNSPRLRVTIDYGLDLLIYVRRLRQKLVELKLAHNITHRSLADLIYGLKNILNSNGGFYCIDGVVVRYCRYIY